MLVAVDACGTPDHWLLQGAEATLLADELSDPDPEWTMQLIAKVKRSCPNMPPN
jgi:hypothetical protein